MPLTLVSGHDDLLQAENRKQEQEKQKISRVHESKPLPAVKAGTKTTVESAKLKARLMALQIERE